MLKTQYVKQKIKDNQLHLLLLRKGQQGQLVPAVPQLPVPPQFGKQASEG